MNSEERDQPPENAPASREGVFDAQLSFPAPFAALPQPIDSIVKRDGRKVAFDTTKIADAIGRAAESVGDEDPDLSRNLAAAVAIYLNKTLKRKTLSVDQVHDAVERVLVEMGHLRTALAYVRYRDRRNRMRALRQGNDAHSILRELTEARRVRESHGGDLVIRTGRDTLTDWDRDKIAEALVRETGLDKARAVQIAQEVEAQIAAARIRELTTSLVRELVDAKLVEHGLDAYRARHMRLGVPLYDAEQIICAPGINESSHARHPEATNLLLAAHVKKEFALSRVYSHGISEAHLRGDIHVHGLSAVDRFESITQPLALIARQGSVSPDGARRSRPARKPETLAAQMAGFTTALAFHCSGPVAWDAVNVYMAPYLLDTDPDAYADLAKVLLYESAFRQIARKDGDRPTRLGLAWNLPEYLAGAEAIGPGGKDTGETYADCLGIAQEFGWAVLDTYKHILGEPGAVPLPALEVTVPRDANSDAGPFLERAADVAISTGRIRFVFDNESPMLPHMEDPCAPREALAHRVTLNLPAAAFRAQNETELLEIVHDLTDAAVQAHIEKRTFLQRLMALNDAGPLALLASPRGRGPLVDLDRALYVVGLCGVNECVQTLCGKALHEAAEARSLAEALVAYISGICTERSEAEGMAIAAGPTADPGVARRFAAIDLARYPDAARRVVKDEGPMFEARYTPGTGLHAPRSLRPQEHVRMESRLHPFLDHGAEVTLPAPDVDDDPADVADLIQAAGSQTPVRALSFSGR